MHIDALASKQSQPVAVRPSTVALLGNPNCGKSSVFNQLTGLRQKVGNFPGVTVDKKVGKLRLEDGRDVTLIDFPGAYSFYPSSQDERLVVKTLANPADGNFPDAIIYVVDVTKLEKHLLLFTQLRDLQLPIVLALNMADIAERDGLKVNQKALSRELGVPVVSISGRTGAGMDELKAALTDLSPLVNERKPFYHLSTKEVEVAQRIQQVLPALSTYQALLVAHHQQWMPFLSEEQRVQVKAITAAAEFTPLHWQVNETMQRYDKFTPIVRSHVQEGTDTSSPFTSKVDRILTHSVIGPIIFFLLMAFVFQAIYAWASFPMDLIEGFFGWLGTTVTAIFPAGWWTDLLTDGLLAGLGGILVFIPQIAILFFLISILEEVGYMARAAFLFDRVMQVFGLNGRSIVALISGGACAIPAIMSTRTIGNWKERLITIMVTPLISCSARIPVYTVLIGFVVPPKTIWGFLNMQGLAFMGLYLFGIVAALLSALVFKLILRTDESSYLMLELPSYRTPVFRNVVLTVWEKVKTFSLEAGKVILLMSLLLWVLANFSWPGDLAEAEQAALSIAETRRMDADATQNLVASKKLEASFAGQIGQFIEPVIAPLGFDWKIGIALITSFAAREVFVGTMATIYSIGSSDDVFTIRDRMAQERDPITGDPVYDLATSLSLLLFYVFAMQCMSTLAVVRRETKSWKWPIIQFTFMTALAYLSSLLVYQLLS